MLHLFVKGVYLSEVLLVVVIVFNIWMYPIGVIVPTHTGSSIGVHSRGVVFIRNI